MSARTPAPTCDCIICKNDRDFVLPDQLFEAIVTDRAALFAGAGISTESRNVLPETFYDSVASQLGFDEQAIGFPDLMDQLCAQPDGRYRLLHLLKSRLDTIKSFPELYGVATRFHDELSTLHHATTIITTNWDTFFEDVCHFTSFVSDDDLAFWDDTDRRILKIHGCVSRPGSLVATSEDYERCRTRLHTGILGGVLKSLLATRTIVFIGYSFRDLDFTFIYDFVIEQMKGMHKQAYGITPFEDELDTLRERGLIPIITSGQRFIHEVKKRAISENFMVSDTIYDIARALLIRVRTAHRELFDSVKVSEFPQVIYAACYQDGMIHALERMINMRGSGKYSHVCHIQNTVLSYVDIKSNKLRRKQYEDVAYIEGYVNALICVLMINSDEQAPEAPMYYAFGHSAEICTLDQYHALLPDLPKMHKSSYRQASALLDRLDDPSNIEMHHPPWL